MTDHDPEVRALVEELREELLSLPPWRIRAVAPLVRGWCHNTLSWPSPIEIDFTTFRIPLESHSTTEGSAM